MSLFRIYIDEVGNHDLNHADDINQRFLSLTGVIINSDYSLNTFIPEMNSIKREYFQKDPDIPIIFHRKELVNKKFPFDVLKDPIIEKDFNNSILYAIEKWEYQVITVIIDKKVHRDQYQKWQFHPYHYCLSALLERYILFLQDLGGSGDVMVEKRGGKEDEKLEHSYTRLYENGTDFIGADSWHKYLTSRELKLRKKDANIAGLQLTDLIAHPLRRDYLIKKGLLCDSRDTFGDKICSIVNNNKYRRSKGGKIEGYGIKFLP